MTEILDSIVFYLCSTFNFGHLLPPPLLFLVTFLLLTSSPIPQVTEHGLQVLQGPTKQSRDLPGMKGQTSN